MNQIFLDSAGKCPYCDKDILNSSEYKDDGELITKCQYCGRSLVE